MLTIYYIDDDPLFYNDLSCCLPNYCLLKQVSVESIAELQPLKPLTDIVLINPDYIGINNNFINSLLDTLINIPVIYISETISLPFVVSMVKNGAYSFLHKKKDKSILIECIKGVLYKCPIEDDISSYDCSTLKNIIGNSKSIISLKKEIINFRGYALNVHLHGETGTGKELTAKALHRQNFKIRKSMVAVNCGAIPESLIESELFGTIKGAYTDAINRSGLIEQADGTTIFLDEIGELSKSAQVKLLRVLEDGIFTKVGDSSEKKSNFNLITATNKNLKKEMIEGRFREDLYYRITSLVIKIPPLRERREDIFDLSNFFLDELKSPKKISQSAVLKLLNHSWPGNIRELKQTIIRADYMSGNKLRINKNNIIFY